MGSALLAKSWRDLTRRRARAALAVATLALAISSLGIFAVPPLMDDLMQEEVEANRLADLTVDTRPLPLGERQLASLRRLPNVAAVEPRSFFETRLYVGARRERAFVIGVRDFRRQNVDIVRVASGSAPAGGQVLTEVQNERQDKFGGGRGDVVRVIAADGTDRSLRISGEGTNLEGGQEVTGDETAVVLYATPGTVAALSGEPGYSSLAFRLRDTSEPAVDATIAAVRDRLRAAVPGFTGFSDLPGVRAGGDWPGKAVFEDFLSLFYIIIVLALVSGLVLIANTITTLVAEQTGEIATMKAIGGRRRQIAGIYVRTAVLLGALGAAVGVPLGILLANLMVGFFATNFFAVDGQFGVSASIVIASVAIGVLGPALAALPAIRRGVRLPLRDALERGGVVEPTGGAVERGLLRIELPRTAQIGVRSVWRRRRRGFVTALIVALAVGNLLGIMALASGVTEVTRAEWGDRDWQFSVDTNLRRPLDAKAERIISSTPGVEQIERVLRNDTELEGRDAFLYGVSSETFFRHHVTDGRWYTPEDEATRSRVTVLERNVADAEGVGVGDTVRLTTGTGTFRFRVVGIVSNQQENGFVAFVPLATAREVLGTPDAVNSMWIRTTSRDYAAIDRTNTLVEDRLLAQGYEIGGEVTYVGERDNVAANRTLTTSIAVLGFLIVAISMVGLVSAITMSVLERTREIGILRCVGARARDIRRIFATEGVTIAALGWALGIPLGYAVDRLLVWLLKEVIGIEVPVTYPASHILIALAGTVLLTLVVMALPLRRAAGLRPGDALRYA